VLFFISLKVGIVLKDLTFGKNDKMIMQIETVGLWLNTFLMMANYTMDIHCLFSLSLDIIAGGFPEIAYNGYSYTSGFVFHKTCV
jgi:hypothetical protein